MTLLIIGDGAEDAATVLGAAALALEKAGLAVVALDFDGAEESCQRQGPAAVLSWTLRTHRPSHVLLTSPSAEVVAMCGPAAQTVTFNTDDFVAAASRVVSMSADLPTPGQRVAEVERFVRESQGTARRTLDVEDRRPRVSLVAAVYNQEKYLHQLLNSSLASTFQDYEVVIVDDGSTDASPAILEQYSGNPKVRVVTQDNLGQTGRMDLVNNRMVRESRGDLVAFLGGDDVNLPHRLEQQVAAFDDDPGLDLCHSASWFIDESGHRLPGNMTLAYAYDEYSLFRRLALVNSVSHPTVMMKRSAFERVGYYEQGISCDYHMWLKSAHVLRYRYLPQRLMEYRLHDKALSTTTEGSLACHTDSNRFRTQLVQQRGLTDFYPELQGSTDDRALYEAAIALGNAFQGLNPNLSLYAYGLADDYGSGPEVHHNRALTHVRLGQRSLALADAMTAARLDPHYEHLVASIRHGRPGELTLLAPRASLLEALTLARRSSSDTKKRWDGSDLQVNTAYVAAAKRAPDLEILALAAWAESTKGQSDVRWAYPTLGATPDSVLEHLVATARAINVDLSIAAPLEIELVDDLALLPPEDRPTGLLLQEDDVESFYRWMARGLTPRASVPRDLFLEAV